MEGVVVSWHEEAERLRSLTCIKWTHFPDDVIPAWVADMDFPTAPAVTDALRALVERSDFGYNWNAAGRVPAAFLDRQECRFGWRPVEPPVAESAGPFSLRASRTQLFCDVVQVLETMLWLHTEPGDGVVLLTPVYSPFYGAVKSTGCRLVDVPLDPDGWRLDVGALASALEPGGMGRLAAHTPASAAPVKAIMLCNPHNPTGRVFTREELLAIAAVAEEHDLLVISDEIWEDLAFPPAVHIPFASLSPDAAVRTVTVTAASKAFNLAGLRCAVAHVGHDGLAAKLAALPGHVLGAVSTPGAEATLAAWTQGDEWLAATLARLEANRDHLAARLSAELPGVRFTLPEATYLAWLDFSAYELGDDPSKRLLREARVALSSGLDFGTAGRGFARLNFATAPELLDEIVDRIVRTLQRA